MSFGFLDLEDINVLKGEPQKPQIKKSVVKKSQEPKKKNIVYTTIPEDEKVQMNRKVSLSAEDYQDFTEALYPYSLNFYDFEVFMHDWMIVIINPIELTKTIIVNDSKALKRYYNAHCEQIWVGYNSRNYDVYIMKSILSGLNPKKTSDDIIVNELRGWQISKNFKKIKFLDFDIYEKNGLKTLEGFMGNDIRETEVDFNLDRKLTHQEVRQTIKYCMYDVEQTLEVFRKKKALYNTQINLIKTFELPIEQISLTGMQLSANILQCTKQEHGDEFDICPVSTLKLNKYKYVQEWFTNPVNQDYKNSLEVNVCGVPHVFGWGGIHGCIPVPIHRKGKIFHIDVTSYYPSIMIRYNLLTRNCKHKEKFKTIYDTRVALKKAGKKVEQAPYKIVLNGTYGITKDKHSSAYDPRQANNICVNGQLMLLDLLEHLEGHVDIIQSNTDGVILQVEDNEQSIRIMKHICKEWIDRTGMGLGFDEIDEIWQGDVNNYVFRFSDGKLERKGAYVKELDDLDNDLFIINKAIVKYLTEDIPVEDTINNCNELKQFQKIVKVSSNYCNGWHNNNYLTDKTFRVFASNDMSDTYIGKCKYKGATVEKFANTPEHCFICNQNINGLDVLKKLNKSWYVNLAKKRLEEKFGVAFNNGGLFWFSKIGN